MTVKLKAVEFEIAGVTVQVTDVGFVPVKQEVTDWDTIIAYTPVLKLEEILH